MNKIHLRSEHGVTCIASLAEALGTTPGAGDQLLFISPHDDDACLGAGLTIALAMDQGFEVHVAIVTDGQGGYCRIEDKHRIAGIRHAEALESYLTLGIGPKNIHFLGFADGTLDQYIGRRPAHEGDPAIEGYTGLENSLTHLIRAVRPQRVFTPASTDLHPDHQAVYKDLLISLFHASGDIWPELGEPCPLPEVYEYPIYVRMAAAPDLMIEGDTALFQRKLNSVNCYVSQKQIGAMVGSLREAGPMEFLRNIRFALYHPSVYMSLFKEAV